MVLPPALGPVMTSSGRSRVISTSTGTTAARAVPPGLGQQQGMAGRAQQATGPSGSITGRVASMRSARWPRAKIQSSSVTMSTSASSSSGGRAPRRSARRGSGRSPPPPRAWPARGRCWRRPVGGLHEERLTALRAVVDDAADPRPRLGAHGHDVPAVAQGHEALGEDALRIGPGRGARGRRRCAGGAPASRDGADAAAGSPRRGPRPRRPGRGAALRQVARQGDAFGDRGHRRRDRDEAPALGDELAARELGPRGPGRGRRLRGRSRRAATLEDAAHVGNAAQGRGTLFGQRPAGLSSHLERIRPGWLGSSGAPCGRARSRPISVRASR